MRARARTVRTPPRVSHAQASARVGVPGLRLSRRLHTWLQKRFRRRERPSLLSFLVSPRLAVTLRGSPPSGSSLESFSLELLVLRGARNKRIRYEFASPRASLRALSPGLSSQPDSRALQFRARAGSAPNSPKTRDFCDTIAQRSRSRSREVARYQEEFCALSQRMMNRSNLFPRAYP